MRHGHRRRRRLFPDRHLDGRLGEHVRHRAVVEGDLADADVVRDAAGRLDDERVLAVGEPARPGPGGRSPCRSRRRRGGPAPCR